MEADIFINHVYLVLSPNSFEQIRDNDFLNLHFANIEKKSLASGNDLKWEGIYIRGKNTFIELFYPQGNVQFSKKGNSGIGFGTDNIGDINLVYSHLKSNVPDINKNKFTRLIDGKECDWFKYVAQKDSFIAPHLSVWCMEYEQEYCGSSDITRATYNAPFYHPSKLFKDITGLTLAVKIESQQNFINLLTHSGYVLTELSDFTYACKSHDFTIEIVPETFDVCGIQKISLELNESVSAQTYVIGETTLTLEGTKGIWIF